MDGSLTSDLDAAAPGADRCGDAGPAGPGRDTGRPSTGGWPRISDYWPETVATGTVGGPGTLSGEATAGGGTLSGAATAGGGTPPGGAVAGGGAPTGAPATDLPAAPGEGPVPDEAAADRDGTAPAGVRPSSGTHLPYVDATGAASGPYPITVISPPPRPPRHRLRMIVALVGAAVFLGVSVLVLARMVTRPDPVADGDAAEAPAGNGGIVVASPSPPVSIAPAPTSAAASAASAAPPPSRPPATRPGPAFAAGTFVLTSDITELNVSVGRPPRNGIARVFSPDDSGVRPRANLDGTTIRLSAEPTGEHGSARVDVLLDERIAWSVAMEGGVERGVFAMAGGEVRGFDLDGGADRLVMTLPRQSRAIPIRMSGGVHTWRIRTAGEFPVEVRLRRGAGEVELNGDRNRGVDRGETLRARGRTDASGGVEVDAVAGVGSLTVEPLEHA